MKTYYLIKSYASRYINGGYEERFHYFGKANKLLGWIKESDVKRYTKDDIRDHGYLSYRKALEAGWALKNEERTPGWSIVITIIAEVA
jgi:hypothetical protein